MSPVLRSNNLRTTRYREAWNLELDLTPVRSETDLSTIMMFPDGLLPKAYAPFLYDVAGDGQPVPMAIKTQYVVRFIVSYFELGTYSTRLTMLATGYCSTF
jgi:hypothetical protein